MKIHRHGEVILIEAKLPEGAELLEESNSIIVGHSESGHHHVLTSPSVIQLFGYKDQAFVSLSGATELRHLKSGDDTHGTQIIAPGVYRRVIKESYSYTEKIMQRVVD